MRALSAACDGPEAKRCLLGQLSRKVSIARVSGEVTHTAPSNLASFSSFVRRLIACSRDMAAISHSL